MKKFRLINLYLKELAEPDALPTDVYGQYFAGSERSIPKGGREINTDEENDLLNALQDYFKNNEKDELETKAENEIFNLINLGKYKRYLKAPTGKKCYRIISGIPMNVAASILGIPEEQMNDVRSHNRALVVNNSGTIKSPDSNIQGWSLDLNPQLFDNLGGISGNYRKDKTVTVLFVSNTNNGRFFINTANFAKNYELANTVDLLPEEREVLSYGPVTFNSAAYVVFNHGLKGGNQHHLSIGLRNIGALLINALNLKTKYNIKADYDKATKAFEEIPEKQKLVADKMAAFKVEVDRFEQIGFDPLIDVLRMIDQTAKKQKISNSSVQNDIYYQIKYIFGIGSEDVNRIINFIEQRKETILANELEGKYEEMVNPMQIFWGDMKSSSIIEIHNPSRTKKVTINYIFGINELEVVLDINNRFEFNTEDKESLLKYLIGIGMFN